MSPPADHTERIKAALADGEVVLFIGAGLSIDAGLPGWAKLIEYLAHEKSLRWPADKEDVTGPFLLQTAQDYVTLDGGYRFALLKHVKTLLAPTPAPAPTTVHRFLPQLQVKTLFTTNYDRLIERAYELEFAPLTTIERTEQSTMGSANEPTLIKVCGDVLHPDTICLTADDFHCFHRTRIEFIRTVREAMKRHHVLYLGYSLSDPFFWQIWRPLLKTFGTNLRQGWAVFFDLPEIRAKELALHNIVPIMLDAGSDREASLLAWLQSITLTHQLQIQPSEATSDFKQIIAYITQKSHTREELNRLQVKLAATLLKQAQFEQPDVISQGEVAAQRIESDTMRINDQPRITDERTAL